MYKEIKCFEGYIIEKYSLYHNKLFCSPLNTHCRRVVMGPGGRRVVVCRAFANDFDHERLKQPRALSR